MPLYSLWVENREKKMGSLQLKGGNACLVPRI